MTPEEQAKKYICPDISTPDAAVYCLGAKCIHYIEYKSPYPLRPPGCPKPRLFACAKARP